MVVEFTLRCSRCASAMLGHSERRGFEICLICREIDRELRDASHCLTQRLHAIRRHRNRLCALHRSRQNKPRIPA